MTSENGNTTTVYDMQFTYYDAIERAISSKTVKATPNPTDGLFRITGLANAHTISVIGLNGQTILSKKVAGATTEVNLSKHAAGVYIVKIANNNGSTENLRVIKQ